MSDDEICGAPTDADGEPCQNPATEGDSCWIDSHGGDTEVGRPREPPSKATQETIASHIESGSSIQEACRRAGVHREQFYRWMQYGDEEDAGPFQEFRDRLNSIGRFSEQRAVSDNKQVTVACGVCGSEKQVAKSDFERRDTHYCKDHHPTTPGKDNPNYIGTSDYRGPRWKTQREKALKRDNYRCVRCGITNGEHTENFGYGLHVHHIQPRRKFDDDDPRQNDLSNLISLCHSCHEVYERLPVRPEMIGDE